MNRTLKKCPHCKHEAVIHESEYEGYGNGKTYKIFTALCRNPSEYRGHVGISFSEYAHGDKALELAIKDWQQPQ